ncbi:MAG TPA: glycogen debranching enzyme, partial [Mycobacterium sp.]
WVDWADTDADLLAFASKVAALRAEHPVFRRRRFFTGRPVRQRDTTGLPDISWLSPDGSEMTEEDWDSGFGKSVAVYLNGQGIPGLDQRGHRVTGDSFVVCFNAHHEPIPFTLPPKEFGAQWQVVIDSANPANGHGDTPLAAAGTVPVEARALVVLQEVGEPPPG